MTLAEELKLFKRLQRVLKRTCTECFRATYKVPIAELVEQMGEEIHAMEMQVGFAGGIRKAKRK